MTDRPYRSSKVEDLAKLFHQNISSRDVLTAISAELQHRSTRSARQLKQQVEAALALSGYESPRRPRPGVPEKEDVRPAEESPTTARSPTARSPATDDPADLSILPGGDSVLAAWTTQEVLTPQPLPSPDDLRAIRRTLVWLRDDPAPWNTRTTGSARPNAQSTGSSISA